ncbi:MAG: hypothetical protein P8X95_05055, partial [Anaerolineales bacterium]
VMAAKYLGSFFDIHCGGEDHISVHHPNEIAQAQVCYGTRLANFWMHGYFLKIDESRMGKSVGNFLRLQTLVDHGYDPLAWRCFCLNAHYRAKLSFNWEALNAAQTALNRLRTAALEMGHPGTPDEAYLDRFTAYVNTDLNAPRALALTWDLVQSDLPAPSKKATLLEFDRIHGLGLADWQPVDETVPDEIMTLAEQRQRAREAKRWQEADALREQIRTAGYEIRDTPMGPRIRHF